MRAVVTTNAISTITIVKIDIGKNLHFPIRFSPSACRFEVDSPSFIFNGWGIRLPLSLKVVHLASQTLYLCCQEQPMPRYPNKRLPVNQKA